MLKKLDRPVVLVIVCSCFFAGFGFAVGEAVQRVNDACTIGGLCQSKNMFELAREYFDPRVTLFTVVSAIVAAVEAGFFVHQLRLKRQVMRATIKADATAREVANTTRALLAGLHEYDLEHELWVSIMDAMKKDRSASIVRRKAGVTRPRFWDGRQPQRAHGAQPLPTASALDP